MPVSRRELSYLALEGGGGKGVAYLGAIRALERMKILPIDIHRPGKNQILGISGASAGAITALLLAMGATAEQVQRILAQPSTFTGFFDGPAPGLYRLVDSEGRSTVGGTARVDRFSGLETAAANIVLFTALPVPAVAVGATTLAAYQYLLGKLPGPMGNQIRRAPLAYLNNLLLDRGLFPGFAPRKFFQVLMQRYLEQRILEAAHGDFGRVRGADTIGFAKFFELTGVDLVITGVNVSTRRPAVFSRRLTPGFPVADAVAISMNLPFIFKPARIDVEVPVTAFNPDSQAYKGLWLDGGVLNNLPVHAFDDNFTDPAVAGNAAVSLNSRVVALRLTEGFPPGMSPPSPPADPDSVGLFAFLDAFANTVLYPSEQGQLRTVAEESQTIDLYTYELETTEFAPPPAKSKQPIEAAEKSVMSYFNPGLF